MDEKTSLKEVRNLIHTLIVLDLTKGGVFDYAKGGRELLEIRNKLIAWHDTHLKSQRRGK